MLCVKCGYEKAEESRYCPKCGNLVTLVALLEFNTVKEVLSDKYEVLREIGRGGMGAVYEAVDKKLNRHVAIKVLLLSLASDNKLRLRFLEEARRGAKLKHPGIVTIYEADQRGDISYFTMELLEGTDLEQKIKESGVLSLSESIDILGKVADALTYAHKQGLVHRDVKPSNIFLSNDGRVLLMDFGICRDTSGSNLTQTGTSMGTPEYMSPEQIEGRADLDARSDIYSLGIIFFQLITGKLPFSAPTPMAVAMKQLNESPPLVTSINKNLPKYLDVVIGRATAKDRNQRYNTALEMISEIMSFKSGKTPNWHFTSSPTVPSASSITSRQPRIAQRSNSRIYYVLFLIALVFVSLGGYMVFERYDKGETPRRENNSNIESDKKKITEIIEQWANAWNTRDFDTYKSFYASDFYGIKRTKSGKTTTFDRDSWFFDRRRMMERALWTSVEANNITFRYMSDREVEIEFEQIYRSDSYSDRGPKVMKLRRDGPTWKIIYEELLYAMPL